MIISRKVAKVVTVTVEVQEDVGAGLSLDVPLLFWLCIINTGIHVLVNCPCIYMYVHCVITYYTYQ